MPNLTVETQAPTAPIPGATPWPLTLVWLGDHWSQDWTRFWTGAQKFDDPAGAALTEGEAAARAAREWWVAMGALWTYPMSVWLASISDSKTLPPGGRP